MRRRVWPTGVEPRKMRAISTPGEWNGCGKFAGTDRRYRERPRRRRPDEQGGGQEDRRGAGRRPGAECPAGHRRERRRELPVVWAVARGSLRNKAILVPAALAISAFLPQAITPLLMLGGAYLCFEGFEKVAHKYLHSEAENAAHEQELAGALASGADMRTIERDKN